MSELNFGTESIQKQLQENEEVETEKKDLPLVERINEKILKGDVIDWENYRQTLVELLYQTVIDGDEEEIKKNRIQAEQFELLRKKHENGVLGEVDQQKEIMVGDSNEQEIDKEWICKELNARSKNGVVYNCDSEIVSNVYMSLNDFLRKRNISKSDALDIVLEAYFTGSVAK